MASRLATDGYGCWAPASEVKYSRTVDQGDVPSQAGTSNQEDADVEEAIRLSLAQEGRHIPIVELSRALGRY